MQTTIKTQSGKTIRGQPPCVFRSIFYALLILFFVCIVFAAGAFITPKKSRIAHVTVLSDPDKAALGNVITYKVDFSAPWFIWPGSPPDLDFPDGIQLFEKPSMNITGIQGWGELGWESIVTVQPYRIVQDATVQFSVPMTPVNAQHPPHTLTTPLPAIHVANDVPEAQEPQKPRLAPAASLRKTDETSRNPWIALGFGIIIVVLTTVIVVFILRTKKANRSECVQHNSLSPAASEAYRRLEGVAEMRAVKSDVFFGYLTDIIRDYMENQLHVPATRRTTSELKNVIRSFERVDQDTMNILEDVLNQADRAKFAPIGHLSESEQYRELEKARTCIAQLDKWSQERV